MSGIVRSASGFAATDVLFSWVTLLFRRKSKSTKLTSRLTARKRQAQTVNKNKKATKTKTKQKTSKTRMRKQSKRKKKWKQEKA